jgi:hypothetical protein
MPGYSVMSPCARGSWFHLATGFKIIAAMLGGGSLVERLRSQRPSLMTDAETVPEHDPDRLLDDRSFLTSKTYHQGGRGVVLRSHKFLGRETHMDLRLPDGKFLLEVPIDFVRTLD